MARTSSNCQVSDDGITFRIPLPGWSPEELDLLHDRPQVKTWRIPYLMNEFVEVTRKQGYLDLTRQPGVIRYEDTHMIFVKTVTTERLVSLDHLERLGTMPYSYGITAEYTLTKVGQSSAQICGTLCVTDSGETLFKWVLVFVCMDRKTMKVSPHPQWWVEKYRPPAERAATPTPRVDLSPQQNPDRLVTKYSVVIEPIHLDFYDHVNNSHYPNLALNVLLKAQRENELPMSPREAELGIRYTALNYLNTCHLDDEIEMSLYRAPDNDTEYYITFYKGDSPVFVQLVRYEGTKI